MRRIYLVIITVLIPFICFSQKKMIEIDELLELQKMDIINAQRYLMGKGWSIHKIKEESSTATIVDSWEFLGVNDVKTARLGIGKINEIVFIKTSYNSSALLSFRNLKYNKMGLQPPKGQYNHNENIVKVVSFENIYISELLNKYDFYGDADNFMLVFEKDPDLLWVFSYETQLKEEVYTLLIMSKQLYDYAVKRHKERIKIMKKIIKSRR